MRVHYVSPSTLPSRAANSIHVAWQCQGLVEAGAEVTLYARRSIEDAALMPAALQAAYGVDGAAFSLATFFSPASYADTLRIAGLAAASVPRRRPGEVVVSRNLYAAFFFGILQRRPILFETHQLEEGARKTLQRLVMTRRWITTVLISQRLEENLLRHHGIRPSRPVVLRDAAPDGITPLGAGARRSALSERVADVDAARWETVCGYFGHLYPGRGIELLSAAAAHLPRTLFLIYGGNDSDVEARRNTNLQPNVRFMGHVPHAEACWIMRAVDVLLMPYQTRVSIGVARHDTADWMSPMKMFEYLASGVPIVSSDLPALREVLQDGVNAQLVAPDRPDEWVAAIRRLQADRNLGERLGARAHTEYLAHYTWKRRAEALLSAAGHL